MGCLLANNGASRMSLSPSHEPGKDPGKDPGSKHQGVAPLEKGSGIIRSAGTQSLGYAQVVDVLRSVDAVKALTQLQRLEHGAFMWYASVAALQGTVIATAVGVGLVLAPQVIGVIALVTAVSALPALLSMQRVDVRAERSALVSSCSPRLTQAVRDISDKLLIPMESLAVTTSQHPTMVAFGWKSAVVNIHQSTLDTLNERELKAVVAHELCHLQQMASPQSRWVYVITKVLDTATPFIAAASFMTIATTPLASLSGAGMVVPTCVAGLMAVAGRWITKNLAGARQQAEELLVDLKAVVATNDPVAAMQALRKISDGSASNNARRRGTSHPELEERLEQLRDILQK